MVDCNSHGCKLLDKDICSKPLCFCWRRVRDRGHSNVSTCMSFALYSDNLHLPLAARTGRAFMHFFLPLYMGRGWLGPWVGAITSWHLHTYLIMCHEKFLSTYTDQFDSTLPIFLPAKSSSCGGVAWRGWVGETASWHLHTYLMLRQEKFYSSPRYVINKYRYIIIYIIITYMLSHKNFSCTSTPTSSYAIYIHI